MLAQENAARSDRENSNAANSGPQVQAKGGELKIEKQMREVAPDVCGDVRYQPVVWKLSAGLLGTSRGMRNLALAAAGQELCSSAVVTK